MIKKILYNRHFCFSFVGEIIRDFKHEDQVIDSPNISIIAAESQLLATRKSTETTATHQGSHKPTSAILSWLHSAVLSVAGASTMSHVSTADTKDVSVSKASRMSFRRSNVPAADKSATSTTTTAERLKPIMPSHLGFASSPSATKAFSFYSVQSAQSAQSATFSAATDYSSFSAVTALTTISEQGAQAASGSRDAILVNSETTSNHSEQVAIDVQNESRINENRIDQQAADNETEKQTIDSQSEQQAVGLDASSEEDQGKDISQAAGLSLLWV